MGVLIVNGWGRVDNSLSQVVTNRHSTAQVESFVRLRQSHGCDPVHVLGPLKGSPHCGHGRTHPREYEQAIEQFASSVVNLAAAERAEGATSVAELREAAEMQIQMGETQVPGGSTERPV